MRGWALVVIIATFFAQALPADAQELVERSVPAPGIELEAEVGQPIVSLERFYRAPSIRLDQLVKTGSIVGNKMVLPAGVYTLAAENNKGRYYQSRIGVTLLSLGIRTQWEKGGVLVPSDGGPPKAYWENDFGARASGPAPGATVLDAGLEDLGSDGFKIQLLYGGLSKGTVSLSYREFMRDLARPAFSQELSYDLTDGEEIGFRGARIRVLKATNVSIRYMIIKPLARPAP